MYKQFKNIITQKNLNTLWNEINNKRLPFYLTTWHGAPFVYHQIIKRPEVKKKGDPAWNTPYASLFLDIFETFCRKAKIKKTQIYRAALNITFPTGPKKCAIHSDHDFPHRQLLIYLNDADPNSKTVILNDKKKIIKKIKPQKNTGVMFGPYPHYHILPKSLYRAVLVYTFK